VVALPAAHVERPHAVGAHVAEGHGRAGLRSWPRAHAGEDTASAGPKLPGSAALRRVMTAKLVSGGHMHTMRGHAPIRDSGIR